MPTSRPHRPHGSIWWNAGSRCLPNASFDAAFTAQRKNSEQPSTTSSNTTTKTQNPSSGTKPPTRSSIPSLAFVNELTTQDTSINVMTEFFHGLCNPVKLWNCEAVPDSPRLVPRQTQHLR